MYSDIELKVLRDKLSNLEEFQQIEIFKIITKNNIKYTKNSVTKTSKPKITT